MDVLSCVPARRWPLVLPISRTFGTLAARSRWLLSAGIRIDAGARNHRAIVTAIAALVRLVKGMPTWQPTQDGRRQLLDRRRIFFTAFSEQHRVSTCQLTGERLHLLRLASGGISTKWLNERAEGAILHRTGKFLSQQQQQRNHRKYPWSKPGWQDCATGYFPRSGQAKGVKTGLA